MDPTQVCTVLDLVFVSSSQGQNQEKALSLYEVSTMPEQWLVHSSRALRT